MVYAGAIAVVATLVYLAVQLRQNTSALRSASYEHWNTVASTYAEFIANNAEELGEIEELSSFDELSPRQLSVFMGLINIAVSQAETAFLLHRAGNLDEDVFEARIYSFLRYISVLRFGWIGWDILKDGHIEAFTASVESKRADFQKQFKQAGLKSYSLEKAP